MVQRPGEASCIIPCVRADLQVAGEKSAHQRGQSCAWVDLQAAEKPRRGQELETISPLEGLTELRCGVVF